jgi:hypothetical protein
MIPEWKTPASAMFWVIGVFVFGIVVRVGWEFGGKVWTLF